MTRSFLTGALALLLAAPVFAADIKVMDAYARASGPTAKTGAAFMELHNTADTEDRLIAVTSDVAKRVELHSHTQDSNGVMRMGKVDGGISVPANGIARLQRGGDHVMFLGLTRPFVQGERIDVTLTFENAGAVSIQIPIDLDRKPDHSAHHGHSHGAATN